MHMGGENGEDLYAQKGVDLQMVIPSSCLYFLDATIGYRHLDSISKLFTMLTRARKDRPRSRRALG